MAKQVSKSQVLAKVKRRAKGAWDRSRQRAAKAKGAQLPDGIVRGVAQFTDYKMSEDKKGNPYVILQGVVKDPEDCDGMNCSVAHFIRETKTKTVEDKLDNLSSDLQLLTGDGPVNEEGLTVAESDVDDWPDILDHLKEARPFFLFNTWKPADGDVMVFIQGLAEDWEPDEEEAVEDDEDQEAEDQEGEEEEVAGADTWAEGDRVEVDGDWSGTVASIDSDTTATVTADEDATDYEVVLESLTALEDEEEGEEEPPEEEEGEDEGGDEEPPEDDEEEDAAGEDDDEEAPWVPLKGDVYLYKASSKGKPREVEVVTVNKGQETVSVKRVDDGKTFKGVSWDKLEGAEE